MKKITIVPTVTVLILSSVVIACSAPAVSTLSGQDNLTGDSDGKSKSKDTPTTPARATTPTAAPTTVPTTTTTSGTTPITSASSVPCFAQCASTKGAKEAAYANCTAVCQDQTCDDNCWNISGCAAAGQECDTALAPCDQQCPQSLSTTTPGLPSTGLPTTGDRCSECLRAKGVQVTAYDNCSMACQDQTCDDTCWNTSGCAANEQLCNSAFDACAQQCGGGATDPNAQFQGTGFVGAGTPSCGGSQFCGAF